MDVLRSVLLAPFLAVLVASAMPVDAAPESEANVDKEIAAMHPLHGSVALPVSHGTFAVPEGLSLLDGADARRVDQLISGEKSSDVEAVLFAKRRTLYLSYDDSGFVTADDWKDVDTTKMLADMKSATIDGNEERKANGVSEFFVDRWVQPPTYDPARKNVRWIVGLHGADGRKFVNAVALSLGRHGYERFTLVSDGTDEDGDRATLASFASDYTFDKGFRFQDYVSGDKLAGYGLAALVGTGVGVTLAKTGFFVAALLFVKKFIIIIIALAAGLFNRIRNAFTGGAKMGPPEKRSIE